MQDGSDRRAELADLARTNLLPTIWVPSPEIRAWRQLLRGRATLVRRRTRAKNRIHGALAAENLRVGPTDLFGRSGREWLERAPVTPGTRREIAVQLAVIAALEEQLRGYDTEVISPSFRRSMLKSFTNIARVGSKSHECLHEQVGGHRAVSRFHLCHP